MPIPTFSTKRIIQPKTKHSFDSIHGHNGLINISKTIYTFKVITLIGNKDKPKNRKIFIARLRTFQIIKDYLNSDSTLML